MKELREPITRTAITERRVRQELVAKYGTILTKSIKDAIVAEEMKLAKKRQLNVDKARLKLLRTKDIASFRRQVRKKWMNNQGSISNPTDNSPNLTPNQTKDEDCTEVSLIEVDY